MSNIHEIYSAIYSLVEARKEDHFILTSSGAEGVNHAIFSAYLDITRKTGKNHYLCGSLDEAPAIMAMNRLAECGCLHEMVPADTQGKITAEAVAQSLTPRTAMLSLSWASGLTGVIQPVAEIAEICRERDVLFHVDATHVVGKGYYTFEASGADILTFDGPAGSGGMFIREGVEITPFILGGEEQAHMRAGRVSHHVLEELSRFAKQCIRFKDHICMETARLRDRFEAVVGEGLFADQERVPHLSAHIFPSVSSDLFVYLLRNRGIDNVTFGGNRLQHITHVLEACGVKTPDSLCGSTFYFTHETTEEEVEKMGERALEVVKQVRGYCENLVERSI